jgi:hypothetical protein
MSNTVLLMMIQLVSGALVTLFAILLWSKTRDSSWMLVIIGVILWYGRILFEALELFGVARLEFDINWLNILALAALQNLPVIFIGLGIIVVLNRKT